MQFAQTMLLARFKLADWQTVLYGEKPMLAYKWRDNDVQLIW